MVKENILEAVGKRKTAIAILSLKQGKGAFTVNKKEIAQYFKTDVLRTIIIRPLILTNNVDKFDINVLVKGGGTLSQAEATRHALTRVLLKFDANTRPILKKEGFITRDSRIKERKKYGQPGARKKFQYSKR